MVDLKKVREVLGKIVIGTAIAYAVLSGVVATLNYTAQAIDASDRAKLKTWIDRIELVKEVTLNDNCKLQHWRHYYGQPSVADKQWIMFYVTLCGDTADVAILER